MTVRGAAIVCLVVLAACGTNEGAADPAGSVVATTAAAAGPSTTMPTVVPPSSTTPPVDTTVAPTTAGVDGATGDGTTCVRVTDFDEPDWVIVNDGVMGGRSIGEGVIVDGVLVVDGTIVTQGGGFSSVRGPIDGQLAEATELVMRLRTDGRDYELLADDAPSRRERVTHYRPIEFVGTGWQEVTVSLSDLEPRIFGSPVVADPFQPSLATEIGVILADGLDGPFSFEIDWIDACA